MSWQLATKLGLGAWKAYEAYKFAKDPVGYSQSHGLLGDPPITFGSRKKQKTSKSLWTHSKLEKRGSKKLYKDTDEMPSYGRKSRKRGGKGGVYQGKRVPANVSSILPILSTKVVSLAPSLVNCLGINSRLYIVRGGATISKILEAPPRFADFPLTFFLYDLMPGAEPRLT